MKIEPEFDEANRKQRNNLQNISKKEHNKLHGKNNLSDLNWQIKKRAVWISLHSEWTSERALEVLKASIIEHLQGHNWSLYMWLDYYHEQDFGISITFSCKEYEHAFNPF